MEHPAPYGPALDPSVPVSPEEPFAPVAPPPPAPPPANPFDIGPPPSFTPSINQASLGQTLGGLLGISPAAAADLQGAEPTAEAPTTSTNTTLGAPGDFGFGIGSQGFADEGFGPSYGGPEDAPAPAPAPSYGGSKSAGLGTLGGLIGSAQAADLSSQNNDQAAAAANLAATTQAQAN